MLYLHIWGILSEFRVYFIEFIEYFIEFIGFLAETVLHQLAQSGFLGVSAGKVFGQVQPAILWCIFGLGNCPSSKDENGEVVPLAENSWTGLAWLGALSKWGYRMVSLVAWILCVRLTRWLGLGTLFSSRWGDELASLPWQGNRTGPRAYSSLFGDLSQAIVYTGFPGQVSSLICSPDGESHTLCCLFKCHCI